MRSGISNDDCSEFTFLTAAWDHCGKQFGAFFFFISEIGRERVTQFTLYDVLHVFGVGHMHTWQRLLSPLKDEIGYFFKNIEFQKDSGINHLSS